MLDKLKKIKELKDLQNSLSSERAESERDGIKVVVNGKLEIEEIKINAELENEKQEEILKYCLNNAIKKMQMIMAKKMSQIKGLGF